MKVITIIVLSLMVVACGPIKPKPITSVEQQEFMKECLTHSRYVLCEGRWELYEEAIPN